MPCPNPGGREVDGREEVGRRLEVSGCDPSEVLQAIEESLDPVALAVECAVYTSDDADVRLARDVGGCSRGFDSGDHRLTEVPPVADNVAGQPERRDEFRCRGLVGRLAGGQEQSHRQAATVHHGVDLGCQPSTGKTDGVIRAPLFPPAACWWARTIELSIKCSDPGDRSASASKMRSQTPLLAHLL